MTTFKELGMAKKSSQTGNSSFDDGKVSRSRERDYKQGIYQMAQPVSRRPQILAKVVVWGSVILLLSFVVYNAIMANANRNLNSSLMDTVKAQYNPSFRVRYQSIGAEVIDAWYKGQPAPINVSAGLGWNTASTGTITGTSPVAPPADAKSALTVTGIAFMRGSEAETKTAPGRFEERLEYYAMLNGVPYIVGVTIAIPDLSDTQSVPTLVSTPSIVSKTTLSADSADPLVDPTTKSKMVKANVSPQELSVIDTWAKAWTEDSPSALKSATADPQNANFYRGLGGGWAYVPSSAKVLWSAVSPDGGGNAIARVTWQMKTADIAVPANPTTNAPATSLPGAVQTQTMDILVGKFDQGSPSVIAWGQPGTYQDLKPFMNAISKDASDKIGAPLAVDPASPSAPAAVKPSAPAASAPATTK